jgi:hypothetical protein
MTRQPVSDVAFSPSVKAEQQKRGSREGYRRMEEGTGWRDEMTDDLVLFLFQVRSFYLGTASASGQPYIQHRGGPPGFLMPLDRRTLGFADYGGNKQYITLGNLAENPRAFLFVMDYARRRRLKFWGRAVVVEDDPELLAQVSATAAAEPERVIRFEIEAWDRNCPSHIPMLLPADAVEAALGNLQSRIAELEAEVARLSGS